VERRARASEAQVRGGRVAKGRGGLGRARSLSSLPETHLVEQPVLGQVAGDLRRQHDVPVGVAGKVDRRGGGRFGEWRAGVSRERANPAALLHLLLALRPFFTQNGRAHDPAAPQDTAGDARAPPADPTRPQQGGRAESEREERRERGSCSSLLSPLLSRRLLPILVDVVKVLLAVLNGRGRHGRRAGSLAESARAGGRRGEGGRAGVSSLCLKSRAVAWV
jgi:hypothetical protein